MSVTEDVAILRQALSALPDPVSHPALVVVSGLPGTGKSYFSRRLAQRLPLALVESDAMRQALFPNPSYSPAESKRLFQACHQLIEELLHRGVPVIFDATNLQESHREQLYHIAHQAQVRLVMVWVEAPPQVVQERMRGREQGLDPQDRSQADWQVYRRLRSSVEPIQRNFFRVDSSRDIEPVIEKIVRELRRR